MKRLLMILCLALSATPVSAGSSLYPAAKMRWTDETGKEVRLERWKGRPVVLTMAYTSCTYTCPLIVKKLKEIESRLETAGKSAEFVVASFDPSVDTVERLAQFKAAKGVGEHWHFLRGTDSGVRSLSVLLGINFRKDPKDGSINHGNRILLLDPDGEISVALDGLNGDSSELVQKAIQAASRDSSKASND